jgi:hypothetical protein
MDIVENIERYIAGTGLTPGTRTRLVRARDEIVRLRKNQLTPAPEQPAQQDIPDLIAGALGVSRGTAYDMMREALAEQPAESPEPPHCMVGGLIKDNAMCGHVIQMKFCGYGGPCQYKGETK